MNDPGRANAPGDASDVDLGRVWVGVAAEVWRRHPGPPERAAARLLRSPGLARALFTTPALLLPWLAASAVVLAAGVLAQLGGSGPLVWLIAPAVAAVGIAYSYGPGLDPAWELSCSMPVSDRLVLLTRALAVFAVNAALGLVASAASVAAQGAQPAITVQLTFAWLLPMTAACALALAVAAAVRSAITGAAAGVGGWLAVVLVRGATTGAGGLSAATLTAAVTEAGLYLPYLAVAACCAVIALFATRSQRGLP